MILLLAQLAWAGTCPDEPQVVRQGEAVTVTFCPEVAKSDCAEGCWAGATLRRASDASHYDLEPVRVEPGATGPITVKGKPGAGYVEIVVGVWAEKTACGASEDRHGCRAWGSVLEGDLWTWPEYAYSGEYTSYTDIGPRRISVLEAGGGAAVAAKARAVLDERADYVAEEVVDGGKAGNPRAEIEILYRGRWHRAQAWALAAMLREGGVGYRWSVKHWPEAPEAFVVAVGGE